MEKDSLTEIPNIGPTLSAKFKKAGINSYEDLARLGSIRAFMKIKDKKNNRGSYTMLYRLEGAVRKTNWHSLTTEEKSSLRKEYRSHIC